MRDRPGGGWEDTLLWSSGLRSALLQVKAKTRFYQGKPEQLPQELFKEKLHRICIRQNLKCSSKVHFASVG